MSGRPAVDVTRVRQAEERLRRSEERFRLLVESVRDYAIFLLDPDGRVATWNIGAERIKGYKADEIIGKHFSTFYPEDAVARGWPEHELKVAKEVGRFEDEGWRVRKDGTRFLANVIITALFDPDGTHVGFAKVTRDVTDRERLTEVARTAREMTEFLAMLAHELRNPLAPIRNAVAIMELVDNKEPSLQWVQQVIARQVDHMTRLVDDLLDVTRITRGKIVLQRAPMDLRLAVNHAAEAAQPFVEERNHTLTLHLPDHPVMVDGDLTRLTQVTTNLLSNASKFTPDNGQLSVTIETAGNFALLRVKDNGIGMTEEFLPHAFDLFAQGERALNRSEGGLGVGLALVQRLIEMHSGAVDARSAGPGKGAEIIVRLPLLSTKPTIEN